VNRQLVLRRVLPAALVVVAVAIAAVSIARDRTALGHALSRIGVGPLLLSLGCAVLGVLAVVGIWRQVLLGLDARAPAAPAARVFLTSQLGKYLPGSVWPVLAQMEFGRSIGINRRRMLTANALMMVLNLALGLVVAGVCLPLSSTAALHRFWWTFLFLPLLVLCLIPRAIPGLLDRIFALAHREPLDARLPVRASLRASAWGLVNWLGLGLQVYLLARPFGATGFSALLAALGGMALAVCAGILFIPAPAGAGIRDAVLVATLTPGIGATNALAVALVSRASLIVVDLLLAGVAQLLPAGPVAATPASPTSGADAAP
jgi:hypothetical protein